MIPFDVQRKRFQAEFRARLPEHLARLRWSAERIAAHQTEALRALLRRVLASSPFHARRLGKLDPDRFTLADLSSLPTMAKAEMMASFDEVVTDRRLHRAEIEARLAETRDEPLAIADDYVCLASGGSSGQRGLFVWHWEDFAEFNLAVMRPKIAQANAHGGAGGPVRGAMIGAGSAIHATRAATALLSGDLFDLHAVPATTPLDEMVARLEAIAPRMVVGYPSMLCLLAAEKEAGRLAIAPASISATSEMLTADAREAIRRAFGVIPSNTFGSSEGLIGVSAPEDPAIVMATDLAIVELVDERDAPVPLGEPSAKVLLTTLHNRAQPLIRYELTDRVTRQPDVPEHGHMRVVVEGRADDVFAWGRLHVHPLAVRSVFAQTPEVSEYQVRQTERGIAVAAVAAGALDGDALAKRLREALAGAGLREPTVTVERVPRIVRHPDTGKVARFVPLPGA